MLSILESRRSLGRREILRIGGLGLGGLTLPGLFASQANAAPNFVQDKSVILLFCHGGPSQIETFDPKMDAPIGTRSITGEVQTKLPGYTFGGTFGKLAERADRLSVVRSYRSGDANHDIKPVVSQHTLKANLGSLYARVAGMNNPVTGMPTNVLLYPQSVVPESAPKSQKFGNFTSTGNLGMGYAPFVPGAGGDMQASMQLKLPRDRLDDRRLLLGELDSLRRAADMSPLFEGVDKFREQAFDTILAGVADAFDLSKEDPATVARYDTAPLVTRSQINPALRNLRQYVDHNRTLGKVLLLARRLCERGCRFVTITTSFVWDNHADVNNAGVLEGMKYCGVAFDHAVSTFIDDCRERRLDEKILLVATGEMGRTPKINGKGGRDHWGDLTPLLLTGGGLEMGRVIGQSTANGGSPATEPQHIQDLVATIYHTLFDMGALRLNTGAPLDIIRAITRGQPIPDLLS